MNLYTGTGGRLSVKSDDTIKSPWLNLSHMGKAEETYANSKYSFSRTQEYGMDGTELDLRMTADGIIVCSHDAEMTGTVNGVETTMTIVSSNYEDLAELVLFTVDGVDYHPLKFESLARMAYYWNWKMLQLDFKSQSNTNACVVAASEVVKNIGLCGKCTYYNATSVIEDVLANDPLAHFDVGSSDITGTIYETLDVEHVWRGVQAPNIGTFVRDAHPINVWNAGASNATAIMDFRPDAIQWQRDTDGVSLTEAYLANVTWD